MEFPMTTVFKDYYIKESDREYSYRIKFAVNNFTDDQKSALEDALIKFDIRSIGAWKNTPIQLHPLDFPNVRNTKVFTNEFVLGYPVTVDELRVYLSDKVGINQQEIAVYNSYDPRDAYNVEKVAITAGRDEKYETALGNDYPEDEKPAYGKEYNDRFLKELEDVRKERPVTEVEGPLFPEKAVDNTSVATPDVGEEGGWSVLGGDTTDGPGK